MQNVYVTPARTAEGEVKRVPDPVTGQALPAGGAFKPCTEYWLRRIAAGDVTEGEPPVAKPAAKPVALAPAPQPEPASPEPAAPVASSK